MSTDKPITFTDIQQRIYTHLEERDWLDNKPRGLAVSIVLEAAELLEHYQWKDEPVGDRQAIAEELADIFIYAFQMAAHYDIDIPEAIVAKLAKAAQKYPAEHFKGKTPEQRTQSWYKDKLEHKKDGL